MATVTHFAPTLKKLEQLDPMCGYVGPNDMVSLDRDKCTCQDCLDWMRPPSEDVLAALNDEV